MLNGRVAMTPVEKSTVTDRPLTIEAHEHRIVALLAKRHGLRRHRVRPSHLVSPGRPTSYRTDLDESSPERRGLSSPIEPL